MTDFPSQTQLSSTVLQETVSSPTKWPCVSVSLTQQHSVSTTPTGSSLANTVPDVKIPVYAIPLMVLGAVALCTILFLLLYLKLRRSMHHKRVISGSSSHLTQSLTTSVDVMRLGSGSYQQPADAIVLPEVRGHSDIGNLVYNNSKQLPIVTVTLCTCIIIMPACSMLV